MAEGFSGSLGALHIGLRINKMQFLFSKISFFQRLNFTVFAHQNPGTGSV
jgi:hypothetical protein